MIYVYSMLLSFVLALAIVPLVKKAAFAVGAVDKPQKNSRKIHTKTIARGGGVAIFIAFFVSTYIFLPEHDLQYWGLIVGSLLVLLVGLVDDIRALSPWPKLAVQVFAAVLVFVVFGIRIEEVSNPLGQSILFTDPNLSFMLAGNMIQINMLALFLTVVWLVGMTNTMNFIDGIDGLSGGIAAIAAGVMFVLALNPTIAQKHTAIISIALMGGCLGYLVYNFHPAKIFNGDSGAYFLGMSLGIIAIFSGGKLATAALVLGVPILDALWAALRRIIAGRSPFSADRGHLHFLLLDVGFTQRQTALIIYMLCIVFGSIALIASPSQKILAIFALLVIIALLFLGLSLKLRNNRNSS